MGKMKDYLEKILNDPELDKKIYDAYMDSIIFGKGTLDIPIFRGSKKEDYLGDTNPSQLIFSSILGKYIDPKTGNPVEEK